MNKIYKVRYNAQTGQYAAVSEMAKNAGKIGRALTLLASSILSTVAIAAGADGVSNDRPSILESRISPDKADELLVNFRENPMRYQRHHRNPYPSSSGVGYYRDLMNFHTDGLRAAGVSEGCLSNTNTEGIANCNHADKTIYFHYTSDYAIEAIKFRDSELAALKARTGNNWVDSNNIYHYRDSTLDLTPGGENNKDVYTLQGGSWDRLDMRDGSVYRFTKAEAIIPSSESLGVADDGRGKNSGLYRDLYVDNATLNVEGSAVFFSRQTNHRSVVYVQDGGKINFKGDHTYVLDRQDLGHTVSIGSRLEFDSDSTTAEVDVKGNFSVIQAPVLRDRVIGILIGMTDGSSNNRAASRDAKLRVGGDLSVFRQGSAIGAAALDIEKSGYVEVKGDTKLTSALYRESSPWEENDTGLKIVQGEFYGVGNVTTQSGYEIGTATDISLMKGIVNLGGKYFNDGNTTNSLYATQSTGFIVGSENNVRSISDIAGKLSVSFKSNRAIDSSTGIVVSGGDMRVGDDIDIKFSQTQNSTGISVTDGLLHTEKALNISIPNSSTENNTGLSINGNHANVEVVGASHINIDSTNSTGIAIVKGVATLGDAQTLDSTTFRAGVAVVDNENAELTLNQGTVTTTGAGSTGVLLTPEDTKKAVYVQAEGTTVKGAGANSNGIWVKQAEDTNIEFDVTIKGKVEETGTATDDYAAVNLSGTGTLTATNTAEILTNEDQVAILKQDDGDVTADVAAKVVGKVLLTGKGENTLTLSYKADSKSSNMKVIDGGAGGETSTLNLKGGGYLLNAYTDSQLASSLPADETVSQLLNWDEINLLTDGTTVDNFVRLNLVGDTTATEKVTVGENNWLTKKEAKDITLTTKLLSNDGNIDLRSSNDNIANNTLTITGDYEGGEKSQVLMNTIWNAPGGFNGEDSESDVLIINGKASGSTKVVPVKSDGTLNVIEGTIEQTYSVLNTIPVVKVGIAGETVFTGTADTTGAGEIQLAKRTVNGSDEYYWTIKAKSGSDIIDPTVPAYTLAPQGNLELGYTTLATLHERRGENQTLAWDYCGTCGAEATGQTWGRIFGKHLELNGKTRLGSESDIYGFQVGHDFAVNRTDEGGHRLSGLYLTYAQADTDHNDRLRAENGVVVDEKYTGKTKTDSWSIGATHTRYAPNGSYLDLVGQVGLNNNKYTSRDGVKAEQKGTSAVISAEVGRPYALREHETYEGVWFIEPQAQLSYQWLRLKDFNDGTRQVKGGDYHGARARLGARLAYNKQADGEVYRTDTIYFVANVLQDLTGNHKVAIGGDTMSDKQARTWWEAGIGGQLPVGKQGYLYADARYEKSFSSNPEREGYRGNIGYKYTWK